MFRDFFNSLSQDRTLVQFIQATLIRYIATPVAAAVIAHYPEKGSPSKEWR